MELLGFVTRSPNRIATLEALADRPQSRPELQERTGIPRATLSRILADCAERGLVRKVANDYHSTALGDFIRAELASMAEGIGTLQELQAIERWLPLNAFDFTLGDLADAEVIRQTPADPHAPVARVIEELGGAQRVRGLCDNALHEAIVTEWRAVTDGGQHLEVVFTAAVVDVVANDAERRRRLGEILADEDTETFVTAGPIPCLVVIANETVLLEAADDEGAIKAFVLTDSPVVRSWAEATFESFKARAESVGADVLAP